MKVPGRYNYIGIFLALRCNLNCEYCLNKQGEFNGRCERSAEEWIKVLNNLEIRSDLPITLEGGEPSLHSGFYNIIEKVNYPLDILSNLQFDVGEFISKVNPVWLNKGRSDSYKSIRISYHEQDREDLLQKAVMLQDAGFNAGIFSINLPEKTANNMKMAELCRKNKIYYFIKDYLGYYNDKLFGFYKYPDAMNHKKRRVDCRIKELLVAPDGKVFRCHRDLYANNNSIGYIYDSNFKIEDIFRPCNMYGWCNPCDVKLKSNRFLEMGSCSVEIKNGLV